MVGAIPQGLPLPALPRVDAQDLDTLLPLALACFLIAYNEFCIEHNGKPLLNQTPHLTPLQVKAAFGPEIDPRYTWYDEMLVSDDTVAVIGYSYERGGTEVSLFNINRVGNLSYRSTYHLRSNDYYSSRNYASRLIGSKLIFYTPLLRVTVQRRSLRAVPCRAQVAQGRNCCRIPADRFGHAHLPARASIDGDLWPGAAYGDRV
jgi:hypothetical protein